MADTTLCRRRRRKIINTTTDIPLDILLHHIAPRLPAKSVFRFMTVCKEFHSFLKTQKFAKMHFHHVTNDVHHQNHDKLLVLSSTKPLMFSTIDCETLDHLPLPSRPLPFEAGCLPYLKILTSFHGLVCVGISQSPDQEWRFANLILWNPVTGDYKILSKTNHDFRYQLNLFQPFGLYYSSCDDDYKLLHVTIRHGAYLYSLKSDSWTKLTDSPSKHGLSIYTLNQSVWLNENLYFVRPYLFSILKFDTKTEKFSEITIPYLLQLVYDRQGTMVNLIVHNGCIHYCVFDGTWGLTVMKYEPMNGVRDWTKVDNWKVPVVGSSEWRLYWMRNGNWLKVFSDKFGSCFLEKFDPEMRAYTNLGFFTDGVTIPDQGHRDSCVTKSVYQQLAS